MSTQTYAETEITPSAIPSAVTTLVPALGRVMISTLFILAGLSKLAAPAMTIGYIRVSRIAVTVGSVRDRHDYRDCRWNHPATRLPHSNRRECSLRVHACDRRVLSQPFRRPESVHPFLQEHRDSWRSAARDRIRRWSCKPRWPPVLTHRLERRSSRYNATATPSTVNDQGEVL